MAYQTSILNVTTTAPNGLATTISAYVNGQPLGNIRSPIANAGIDLCAVMPATTPVPAVAGTPYSGVDGPQASSAAVPTPVTGSTQSTAFAQLTGFWPQTGLDQAAAEIASLEGIVITSNPPVPPETPTAVCQPALATSNAQDCFANEGCQDLFDHVWRCFQTWYPSDEPAQYVEPNLQLQHCCLCTDYIFNIQHSYPRCTHCLFSNLTVAAGVPPFLTDIIALAAEASNVFCSRPSPASLQAFITVWNALAKIWNGFAYLDFYAFDTSTCQSAEQTWLPYYTGEGVIWTSGTGEGRGVPWAAVGASTTSTSTTGLFEGASKVPLASATATATAVPEGGGKTGPAMTGTGTGTMAVRPTGSVNPTDAWLGKNGAGGAFEGLRYWKILTWTAIVAVAVGIGSKVLKYDSEVVSDE